MISGSIESLKNRTAPSPIRKFAPPRCQLLNPLPNEPDAGLKSLMYHPLEEAVGYPVHQVSAVSGVGLEGLRRVLCEGSSALVGPSGAGKSTILNALDPELQLRTGELSRKVDRGRHTTVASRLIELRCGGEVADTPSFSDVGIWASDP